MRSINLKFNSWPLSLVLGVTFSSCTFKFDVTSQKTALENQAIGKYQELEDDLVLVSSVRGSGTKADQVDPATLAKQNQKFNIDDIEELKNMGVLGEGNDGKLAFIGEQSGEKGKITPGDVALARALVREENSDRTVIWQDMVETNKNLSEKDIPEIQKTYARQKQDESKVGQWIQDGSGNWKKKQAGN